jgi:large subunit ribosomal protein L20
MPRVKRSVTKQARHAKVLALTKGHRGTKHRLYRRAKESMFKALGYAYRHRRERKGEMRQLWITRINAAAREAGTTYSKLMASLQQSGVQVNRKMLADLAVRDTEAFNQLVKTALAAGKQS